MANHQVEMKYKALAYTWLAGIYKRRGHSEAEKKNIKPDSGNSLIQLSLQYYEKIIELLTTSPASKYGDVSAALLKIAEVRETYLPDNATLDNEATKHLIQSLEQIIEFHSNVPNDNKTMRKCVGLRHARLELEHVTGRKSDHEALAEEQQLDIEEPPVMQWDKTEERDAITNSAAAMAKLGKLYAKMAKTPGQGPDFHKAVIWLDKAKESNCRDAEIDDLLKKPEIVKAREEVKAKLAETVEITHAKLKELTNGYLNKNEVHPSKRPIFETLKQALENPDEQSKHKRLTAFKNIVNAQNREMLFSHRTEAWKRYSYNVFSVLTIIPALVRAKDSYSKYGTLQFWKPEAQKAMECAVENISKLNFEKSSVKLS